ncbi:helix-turn-helix transcriptional regulator [Saccharothrix sp. Mg75]|uniref:helix-turn-helix transcriptional regulator n=1 Tax=Saccharothrix sp. Mg75 TaxID=3445357 RepID=UPI003EEA3EF6
MTTRWWDYVETNLRNRGLTTGDLARRTGVDRSRISEWKRGKGVSIETARSVARLFEASPLEAWVAAELITAEEARLHRTRPNPADLTDQELIAELARRLARG